MPRVLYFLALMHLYDLDVRNAVIIVFFAGGLIYVALFFATRGEMGMPILR